MNAELKRLHSPDIDDLKNYQPTDKKKFAFLLQAMIGPEGKEGEESFDIEVCTPQWIEETYGREDIIIRPHQLIVLEYNFERINNAINDFLQSCSGDNWKEVAKKVARLGKWEFEDYTEK